MRSCELAAACTIGPFIQRQLQIRTTATNLTPPSGSRSCVLVERWPGPSTCYEVRASYTLRCLQLALLPGCLRFSGIIPSHAGQVLFSLPRYDQRVWPNRARELRLCKALANFCSLGVHE